MKKHFLEASFRICYIPHIQVIKIIFCKWWILTLQAPTPENGQTHSHYIIVPILNIFGKSST